MSADRWFRVIATTYLVGALLTFGAAWHLDYETVKPNALVSQGELNGTRSLLMAGAWPLYWSVKIIGRVFFGTPMKRDA